MRLLYILLVAGMLFAPVLVSAQEDEAIERAYAEAYLEAINQREKGDYAAQYNYLQTALALKPNASEALYEMAKCLGNYTPNDTTNRTVIITYLERAVATEPDNNTYLESLAYAYYEAGEINEALDRLQILTKRAPTNTDYLTALYSIYKETENTPQALQMLDKIEWIEGESEEIDKERLELFLQSEDKVSALKVVQKFVAQHPEQPLYAAIMAAIYLQLGEVDKGEGLAQEIRNANPSMPYPRSVLIEHYRDKQANEKYVQELNDFITCSEIDTRARLERLKERIQWNEQHEEANSALIDGLMERVIDQPQQDATMVLFFLAYKEYKGSPKDSLLDLCRLALHLDSTIVSPRVRLVQYAISKEDYTEALRLVKEGLQITPRELYYHLMAGLIYLQQEQYNVAVAAFLQGVNHIAYNSDAEVIADIFGGLGNARHELGDKQQAYDAYEDGLSYAPLSASLLNNYAYYLALDKAHLEKAEAMSYRTVAAEPENAVYLDTYAWVLFQRGKYEEARIAIDKAVLFLDKQTDDAEAERGLYQEHAGDIYWHCGLFEEALSFWKQAEGKKDTTETLPKKVKQRKYVK